MMDTLDGSYDSKTTLFTISKICELASVRCNNLKMNITKHINGI